MTGALQRSVVETVKQLIGVPNVDSPSELYSLLTEFRNAQHPDKYEGAAEKRRATELFQEANTLLPQLKTLAEQQMLALPLPDLRVRAGELELLSVKERLREAEQELVNEKNSREYAERERDELLASLEEKRKEETGKLAQDVIDRAKPTKASIVSLSVAGVVTVAQLAVTKIQELAKTVLGDLPIPPTYISMSLVAITATILAVVTYRGLAATYLTGHVAEVQTTACARRLMDYVLGSAPKNADHLLEPVLVDFVGTVVRRRWFDRVIATKLFPATFSSSAVESIKDVLVAYLLERRLIEVGPANGLVRCFNVVNNARYSGSLAALMLAHAQRSEGEAAPAKTPDQPSPSEKPAAAQT